MLQTPTAIKCSKNAQASYKINDNDQYFDFIGGTLSYVTYVMS